MNFTFEYVSIGTVLLLATDSDGPGFWAKHRFNLAFVCYQLSVFAAYFATRFFTVPWYPLLPGLQVAIFVLFSFVCLFGEWRV